jgi:hypothetical protein
MPVLGALQLGRHEAAVDQDGGPVVALERRDDVEALERPAGLARRQPVHQGLLIVQEGAVRPHPAELVGLRVPFLERGRAGRRLGMRALDDAGDQRFLLALASQLPRAQAQQDRETDQRRQARRPQAAQAGASLGRGQSGH